MKKRKLEERTNKVPSSDIVSEDFGGEVPWCIPCKSWHSVPRDFLHHQQLQCRAPFRGKVTRRDLKTQLATP